MSSDTPVFVVGFQRSGTTLLQALLGAHPRIAAPPEMYFVFRIARQAARYGDLNHDDSLRRALHDALNPPIDLLAHCGFDEDRVFERAAAGERTMRGLFEAIMQDFAERNGKARWSDKSPGQSVAQVESLFPEAQILHIVRDPRDVVASSLQTPWTRSGAHALAHEWRLFTLHNIRRGRRAGPRRFLQLHYEDLTREPEVVLRAVFAFLGEDYDPRVLDDPERRRGTIATAAAPWQKHVLDAVVPAPEGRWVSKLSRRDRLIVDGVLHRELAALGYAPPSRRAALAGSALALPASVRSAIRSRWVARRLRDPARRQRAMQAFLDERAKLMQAHSAAT